MTDPRIAIFGLFGRPNLGNEATLQAFLAHLGRWCPDAQVTCIGPRGAEVEHRYGIDLMEIEPVPVRHHLWGYNHIPGVRPLAALAHVSTEPFRRRSATKRIKTFDALFVPGTGILDDFGQGPLDLPHHLLRWCEAAARASVPIGFLSVGAEPVRGRLTRTILRRAVSLATYRSYRDRESKANAAHLGFDATSDPVFPDLAFSLPPDSLPDLRPVTWPPRRIGLGVMGYYGWDETKELGERIYSDYMRKLRELIRWLLERGYSVRLLIGDTRGDERPAEELATEFRGHESAAGSSGVIYEPITSVSNLLHQIVDTDTVVSTRFHNVLLSLLLERPAISISYSRKNDALMESFGYGRYTQGIESFDVGELIRQLIELTEWPSAPVEEIRKKNNELRRQLEGQYRSVFGQLGRM